MFSDLLFFRSPIAPVPTASKLPEGLDFPTPALGTEGQLSRIRAKACLVSYPAADREGRRKRTGRVAMPLVQLCSSWESPKALL